jgi:hypothetical protein
MLEFRTLGMTLKASIHEGFRGFAGTTTYFGISQQLIVQHIRAAMLQLVSYILLLPLYLQIQH